jgi:hypothetical protein
MVALAAEPVAAIVIVAVRFMPEGPAEKVSVAFPVASVVKVDALICPVDAVAVNAWADKIELLEFKTVAVSVTELVPSLLTFVPLEVSDIVVAADVAVAVVVVAVVAVLPHPVDNSVAQIANPPRKIEAVRLIRGDIISLFRARAQL